MLQIDTEEAPRSARQSLIVTAAAETPVMVQQRWRARKRLEDQRQAALRSAVSNDLTGDKEQIVASLCSGISAVDLGPGTQLGIRSGGEPEHADEETPAMSVAEALVLLDNAGEDPSRQEDAVCSAIDALETLVAYEHVSAPSGYLGRRLTSSFVRALEEVSWRVPRTSAGFDDFTEAVALRLANSTSSQYEQPAAGVWPTYAERCPSLTARFQLAQSGLLTYTLGPREFAVGLDWELSGEGCWRLLHNARDSAGSVARDGRITEVLLEMRQGLEGSIEALGGGIESVREPPCTLRVDLRECLRVVRPGRDVEEDEDEEEDDDDDGAF